MSQQDHGLMESVTQDEHVAITPAVPASPPRRDSMEDADPSLTRKRPRLDSGSNDNCAMSTDPVPGAADTTIAPSAEQAVEMTIRSQPPSSSQPTDGADDIDIVSAHAMSAQETSAPIVDNTEDDLTLDLDKDTTVGSPPVLAVDEEEEDAMGDYIQVDLNPEDYYRQFPYASSGDYMGAVRSIINHFHGSGNLDGTVLPQVALWLDNFPTQPSQWQGYFIDKHSFWDEFSQLVNKVLIRRYQWMNALANRDQDNDTSRYPFGEQFADEEQSEDLIFYDFLRSYLEISARLLQVDVDRLSGSTYEGFYSQPLLVQKHLRLINNIIRQEKAPIFHLLNKDYQTDTRKMMHRLTRDFIHASGLEHLFHFAHAICGRVELGLQNWLASGVVQILNQLGWTFLDLPNQGSVVNRSQFCRNVLDLFRKYNLDLQVPSKVLDITVTKELLAHLADLLSSLCQWHETIASELAKEFMDYRDPWSPTPVLHDAATISQYDELRSDSANHAALATNAWKFKLLRKYVVKGRMELRVTSIGIMDSALIDIWREYNGTEHGTDHPIMQYLADFLLREEVVEYIMSVDSHPQIISRSGNVVGFLVVTHRYSDDQTDAIWKTVSHSPDPRVVAATINMLKVIIHLMSAEEQLYLCLKLYQLPIESYTMDIFRFFRELAPKVQVRHLNCSIVDPRSRPWNVCIRIIQDTSPSRDSTKLNGTMYTEACDQLRLLASSIVADERHQIYEACTSYIADRSPKATGSVRAMFILFSGAGFPDNDFFKQNLRIGRHLVEELCAFVKAERQLSFHNTQYISLLCRLDMLCLLLFRAFDAIPVDLYQDLWDHLVGKFALNNQLRDQAWSKFSDYIRHRPENEFFKQLILTYVPRLEPEYYTGGVYEFVASYKFPTTKKLVNTEEGEKEVLQIRGADLLWPMVLNAPMNTIEGRSAKLLAARYVEIDIDQGVSLEEVEEAHVALVEKCTRELLAAYQIIRGKRAETASTVDIGNQMDISVPDQIKQQNELRFSRTLLFQKDLLASIRTKPEFNRSQRSDSKVEALQPELAYMGAIEIKYQSPTTNDKQSVFVNPENTVQDLYTRICNATGFTRVNLFAKGQRLNLLESGSKKVTDMDFGGLLLVQKAPGSGISQPVTGPGATCSVFETTVLKHFEELFACMDSDDHISETLFDFLTCFPLRERIAQSVMTGSAVVDDIFPPGKVFQVKYAAQALQMKLREQLRTSQLDESFLVNAVQLLEEAHLNQALLSNLLSGRHELHLAFVLVNTFLEFLKERPSLDTSSQYFTEERLLVDRLTTILNVALEAENDWSGLAFSAYATILEASLHSRRIWEAFISRADVTALHQVLLLTDPRKHLREQIVQSIASICRGHLPDTSPLSKEETASSFWKTVSAIIPEAVRYPSQSEQLFDIAEQVFRSHDEDSRDEESLRSSLVSWSDLLLSYTHEEFVGRDETDFVVLGFTKLLLCCIPSLKSFKKPLNAGPLIEQIFHKFLFIPKITEVEDYAPEHLGLPVLESKTRKELYDLMLSLAEDRHSYDVLLELAATLKEEQEDLGHKVFQVERSNEIRSSTGYVGLYNPRAICYMNSLVTQLFMNVNFRKFMLGLNVADAGTSQRLLAETQKLFAQLQNTYRKSADPRDFASCAKSLEGTPIDINVQMDADEFYNLLFDQWEGQMLSQEVKETFRSFYGGRTVNQIKSRECEHVSERVESFFVVQCDVQGKTSLQESLQAFVEGDVMEGDNKYKCESCGGKFVDAVKRTCLKDVSDNLIFHLKRFEYDLETMRRSKINDHFEFPTTIDISSYNVDHLSDPSKPCQEDIFELVGVLVHQGTSENGHYYSYIRERPSSSGGMTNWFEFNDREVDHFDHQSLPYHTYGGFFDDQFPRTQKPFSAYMLFYQRRAAIEKDHAEYISSPRCGAPKVPVPSDLEAEIDTDNVEFVREYSLFDPNHSKFVRQILTTLKTVNHGACSEDHQQESQALHIVLEHLCQVIPRLRILDNFDETLLQLRRTVLPCPNCCHIVLRWLAMHDYALIGVLLRCLHAKVRSGVRNLMIDCLKAVREKDPALYSGVDNVDMDMEAGTPVPAEGILVEITRRLRGVADETSLGTRGWDEFYMTMCQISSMGLPETAVVLNTGFLEFCLRILLMHAHVPSRTFNPDIWRLIEKKKPIFNRLIELVYTLLSKMDIRLPYELLNSQNGDRMQAIDRTSQKFPLSLREHQLLHFWHDENRAYAVLDKMIEQYDSSKSEVFYPGEVLKWMLQSTEPVIQNNLCTTVSEGVQSLNSPFNDPYVRAALPFCEVCPVVPNIIKVIDAVAKSATGLRDTGGDAHIQFFTALLTARNEVAFDEKDPDLFYKYLLYRSKVYAVPLLIYDDDGVRKATAMHLEELFAKHKSDEESDQEALGYKYRSVRSLVKDMNAKIAEEHNNGTSRIYMQPMVATCALLNQMLELLDNTESEVMLQYQGPNDRTLIDYFHQNVEARLRVWPPDEGTPISPNDAYENSDYGSPRSAVNFSPKRPPDVKQIEDVELADDINIVMAIGDEENGNRQLARLRLLEYSFEDRLA